MHSCSVRAPSGSDSGWRKFGDGFDPGARVDAHRHGLVAGGTKLLDEFDQKARRQIIDDRVPCVLENVQNDRFARTGHAGNDEYAHESRDDQAVKAIDQPS